ncbi:MAG: hypothetical protein ACP5IL_11435, partial [Syntrophobacteraceae bacterium]
PCLGTSFPENGFFADIQKDSSCALWGAGGVYYKLIHRYEELTSDRFLLVDSNTELQGLNICKKLVNPPGAIAENCVKTVLITALSRENEIRAVLRNNYPAVDTILFPSFEITDRRIVPMLRAL